MQVFLFISLLTTWLPVRSQDTVKHEATGLRLSGYLEGYYAYDFNRPPANYRPNFIYNFNRHNEFNVNLAYMKGSVAQQRLRANLALAVGTYMNANYAAEEGVLKNIYEANAGYKLHAKKNFWFDIGVLPSHIGFESAKGSDNWTLTRSLVAENSPYYETGAKLSYTTANNNLSISVMALNGWQRITRLTGNTSLSYGTQFYYKPADHFILNYSTFIGTPYPDSIQTGRLYHNLYGIYNITGKLGLAIGFDIGRDKHRRNNKEKNTWHSEVIVLKISPGSKCSISLRGEYFSDIKEVIITTGTPNGFQSTGLSVNFDYLPVEEAMLRLEVRNLHSKDELFSRYGGQPAKDNLFITFSFAVNF